jgi:acetoin utilization deacetylase AcuC-like enzyme
MSLLVLGHPDCERHETGAGHPERPARLRAIEERLAASDLAARIRRAEAPRAAREALVRVHEEAYVDALFRIAPSEGMRMLDPDTCIGPHSLSAALHAAGAAVEAVDRVIAGDARAAFCCVRPPGHHAERGRAMGFCLFDNVAVGAAHALAAHGLERVAIVDFDVHHGNGTEDIVAGDPRVLFCSSFQHPFYPFSGTDPRGDNVLPLPLERGTDGARYRGAVEERWLGALDAFRPELVLVSAGFDAHAEDPLAGLALREEDFAWITRRIREIAERHAEGRIVSTLEGGYALPALARSVEAHLSELAGEP